MPLNQVTTTNPATTNLSDQATATAASGRAGETLTSEIRGKYYTPNYRGAVFNYSQAAFTMPVNAATLSSKFGLYNPLGSGKNIELIAFDMAYVLATTVVNGVGLYYSTGTNATGATFTTLVTPSSGLLNGGGVSVASGVTTVVHVGTPVLACVMAYTGAVTSAAANPIHYDFDGRILMAPGSLIAVAMTTAASTASGCTASLTWAEWPV